MVVLSTASFQAVQEYTFGGPLTAAGFLVPSGSALVVMPLGLTAGLRLELYATPARDMPVTMQVGGAACMQSARWQFATGALLTSQRAAQNMPPAHCARCAVPLHSSGNAMRCW